MNTQLSLFPDLEVKSYTNGNANKLDMNDLPFHHWYRFLLSFPPHLVREYTNKFQLRTGDTILDPFCGTGTTVLEAKLNHLRGIGIEANAMAFFASKVKTNFDVDTENLYDIAQKIAKTAKNIIDNFSSIELLKLSPDKETLILKDSISPVPLHKTLLLRNVIRETKSEHTDILLLALATSTVKYSSNLHFGPEVGVTKKKKHDTDVINDWLSIINMMIRDLSSINRNNYFESTIYNEDSRNITTFLKPKSIDAVFTSPPYPNEKDYTRTTRLESVILDFITSKQQLRELKQNLLRSNSRNVYKGDDDDQYILHHPQILKIANEIENRRIALNKTSGFEKMYHKVTKLYFGGMAKHLNSLKPYLKTNALLGYVVGDQASYLQVYIPTGKILADIAEHLGYEVVSLDLFRTRFATATKKDMNEEVLVLKWRG
ncbi:MAG: DNA methyltransferase [Ignavibacterium sp.]